MSKGISLACEGFGLAENYSNMKSKSNDEQSKRKPAKYSPTTAAGSHGSDVCFKARKMTLEERKNILSQKKSLFPLLKDKTPGKKNSSSYRNRRGTVRFSGMLRISTLTWGGVSPKFRR
ncbi:hypothetical protein NQ317_000643 [Molorchus minor]|uniref:Uncharacterized protein n=1 Tax=Molorchus minor TaxID=1323400 RepID=A0ABQ9J1A4_9CUCU|nr:hypothetical protein NQ317_000643 [Molorchus minor]